MSRIIESAYVGSIFEIEMDEDIGLECMGILAFEHDERSFLAVHPMEEIFDEGEVIIFEMVSDGDELQITDIDDETEYDEIFEEFEVLMYAYRESIDEYDIIEETFGAE